MRWTGAATALALVLTTAIGPLPCPCPSPSEDAAGTALHGCCAARVQEESRRAPHVESRCIRSCCEPSPEIVRAEGPERSRVEAPVPAPVFAAGAVRATLAPAAPDVDVLALDHPPRGPTSRRLAILQVLRS